VTSASRPADSAIPVRHAYGPYPAQYGELYLPTLQRKPGTVVILHGGFWRSSYGAEFGAPLAADLARRGYLVWNLEYRRVGSGGGWPNTLADVAAGIDHLAVLKASRNRPDIDPTSIDLTSVVAIGHSAGGHLATWAAGRSKLPATAPGANPVVPLTGVVSQAGVLDLARAAREKVGGTAVPDLLGGSFEQVAQRYAEASPQAQLPVQVPVRCVHGPEDETVPFDQSVEYV
jgi:acetyl esterase/lipase